MEIISRKLAENIKSIVPEHPASVARLQYALSFILNAVFIIVGALLISAFSGRTGGVIAALVSFAILRQASGGIHLKSGTTCVIVSIGVATALSFTPDMSREVLLAINLLNLALVLIFAPTDIEKQSRIPRRFYPLLKLISAAIVCSNLLIGSSIIAVTLLVQCMTLILAKVVKNP
ncbi:accessory gene regulator B [Paenibacillus algorifonticola]|uniref:Accessory gene regulator B n=1 Tax=Paenibacillus algorifonticola TaxID=684063 RepID=A0A1I2AGK5_9BACL|nr:accessory gene regulator B family protein [Paenibacillus algorifonticola]SFE43022.1 accessory gene regulator B [Paenibacillus algorifonticola]